jgi:membrane-anchored protein YejM (alkaline phosphatase superfamily)
MEEKHSLNSKIILVISIIGFSGIFLVPIFGTIDNMFWGEIISGWTDLFLFIIFAILCLIAMILTFIIKSSDKYRQYAFIIALIGFIINGFWIFMGLGASSY